MALFLTEEEVAGLLPMSECIRAVEDAFRQAGQGLAHNLPRERLRMPRGTLHFMAASLLGSGTFGYKAYGGFGGGKARFHVMLYDSNTGEMLAIMEAGALGQIRTGAVTGVAGKYMARADASVLGVIGSGYQAETQLKAVCHTLPIKSVRVFSRSRERREAFARKMVWEAGVEVVPVASAEECVSGAQAVVTITNSAEPVLRGVWLEPGMFVAAAGGNAITRRELDEEAVRRASLIVVDDLPQAKAECGDLVWPVDHGLLHWEQVFELKDVVAGRVRGRPAEDAVTLFESQGIALEDVAAATYVYRHALEHGAGQKLPL